MNHGRNQREPSKEILIEIGQRNHIQIILHTYLAKKHDNIFRKKAASGKDYAVAFFVQDETKTVLSLGREEKSKIPEPNLKFFSDKEYAKDLLGTNPNSVMIWRHSPKLELMY